ncbi:MAG: tagaturonate epimerase family protein [Ignisphaera sp.]|nr:tagaturonate epimerase family protein [Ignisphaera sp.]
MYLGKMPRPAFGIRIPEIVVPAVLKSFKELNIAGTLMLSFNRETAPEKFISSLNPKHFYLGHTGTSISRYIASATDFSKQFSIPIEIEADHVSIMGSVERALKRIAGVAIEESLSDSEISESLGYIEEEFKEVSRAGGVDFVTIDTCELVGTKIEMLSNEDILYLYENRIEPDYRRSLENRFLRSFNFVSDDRVLFIKFTRMDVAKLALKYDKSIRYIEKVVDIVKKYNEREFGIEVALDELPLKTGVKDALFYAAELIHRGINIDFLAPNIGFRKREDYTEDLSTLYEHVRNLHTVLSSIGVCISIHSGSGAHPYSDKGAGVWEVVRRATGGLVKYKMSGVLIQLLLEILYQSELGTKPRRIYDEIYDSVLEHIYSVVKSKDGIYSPELEKLLKAYEESSARDPTYKRNPRADVFRHYFYLFQTIRDAGGFRKLREELINLLESDAYVRKKYEVEVNNLIDRFSKALGFTNNINKYKVVVMPTE